MVYYYYYVGLSKRVKIIIYHVIKVKYKILCNSTHVNKWNNECSEFSYANWGEGYYSVPGVNPISRKRDESVAMMSFPCGLRTLRKTR